MSKYISVLLLFISISLSISAQNIYDKEHTKQFAIYLTKTGQYKYAAEEYERLLFLDTNNVDVLNKLIDIYKLDKQYIKGLNKIEQYYPNSKHGMLDSTLSENYLFFLLRNKYYSNSIDFINKYQLFSTKQELNYKLSTYMLDKKWDKTFELYTKKNESLVTPVLSSLIIEKKNLSYKKPWLAATMSAFIPGLGKVYSKNWKDGLIALLFVSANTWQSYRGFKKNGTKSAYGWIFGGLAFGFYSGNVYGAYKSAIRYNKRKDEKIQQKIQRAVFDTF